MRTIRVCLAGPGNVGTKFLRQVRSRSDLLARRYGLKLVVPAIVTRKGGLLAPPGRDLVRSLPPSPPDSPWWLESPRGVIVNAECDVLVDATPSNLVTGEPGLSYIRLAIDRGWHIVSISKGALAVKYGELIEAAEGKGLKIRASGAAGAALPAVDVGTMGLAGSEVTDIEGVLTGTANYILSHMLAEDVEFAAALTRAQQLGIAEPDPGLDVGGMDTAAKLVIITNMVMGTRLSVSEVDVVGIEGVSRDDFARARARSGAMRLVGRSVRDRRRVVSTVEPRLLEPGHPLAGVQGASKGVRFRTSEGGEVTVTGGASDPDAAAAAAIRDIVNLAAMMPLWCEQFGGDD